MASGICRHTLKSPKFHNCLVEVARVLLRHYLQKLPLKNTPAFGQADVVGYAKYARNHPVYVTVDDRHPLVKRDRRDGSGRIRSYTLQFEQAFVSSGKFAPMLRHHSPSAFVEVPGPGVVSKSLPKREYILLFCPGEVLYRWKGRNKLLVVWQALGYPGLLKYDFGKPDGISVGRLPPRKLPFVMTIPLQQKP